MEFPFLPQLNSFFGIKQIKMTNINKLVTTLVQCQSDLNDLYSPDNEAVYSVDLFELHFNISAAVLIKDRSDSQLVCLSSADLNAPTGHTL